MNSHDAIYLIEGGKALELVQKHVASVIETQKQNFALAKELGVTEIVTSRQNGRILGIVTNKSRQLDGFCKPKRDGSRYPKRGSDWDKRFNAVAGFPDPVGVISAAFNVPMAIAPEDIDGSGWGNTAIGTPLNECGFLYCSENGPYALWIPDIPYYVGHFEEDGKRRVTTEGARDFDMNLDGCKRISEAEWKLIVAQYKVDQERAAA